MNFFGRLILRRAGWILLLSLGLSMAGAYFSVSLYKNLKTDIEELLPTQARSVIDLNEVTSRLESTENLAIVVLSDHPPESRKFVIDLAERLNALPKSIVASVEYRIDRELQFFAKRRALYMDTPDLLKIRDFIKTRISYEKELYNPINIFRSTEIPEPHLDFVSLAGKYSHRISAYTRFPGGFYATQDEKIRVLLVNLPGKLSGIDGAKALREAVDHEIAVLNPSSYAPDLQLKFTGGVQNLIEEHASLMADLELSTLIVFVLVTLVLYLYYKTFRGTLALTLSLIAGTLWTFGTSYFLVGYLNANSAFLGAIVLGNGINFGVIFLARYMEERRRHVENTRAVYTAMKKTVSATGVAALAAGLAYASLMLTGFRGFRQFGIIGFTGMMVCWLSAYTVLPALLVFIHRVWPIPQKTFDRPTRAFLSTGMAYLIQHWPRWIWGISCGITLLAVGVFVTYDGRIIETDLSKLRDKTSMERGSAYNSKYVDQVFERYLSPVVILPKTRELSQKIAEELKSIQKRQGSQSFLSAVYSMDDFVPKDQDAKIAIVQDIRHLLPERMLKRLSAEQQQQALAFLAPENFAKVAVKDLPPLILSKFTERDGTIGKLVLVEPPLSHELWDGDNLVHFVKQLREVADTFAKGTAVAGSLPVTSDMFESIRHDGPRATLFAFFSVILLTVFLFRNLKTVSLVLISLVLGVLWLGGLVLALDLKINFLNFIALPITFGIGVDYGVNMFQRYRLEGSHHILKTIRQTGGAVGLASLTTIIGYGSLLIAGNQAFVSFGKLAVIGEITCLLAAVMSLPAYLYFKDLKKSPPLPSRPLHEKIKPRIKMRYFNLFFKKWFREWPLWWNRLPIGQKILPGMAIFLYWVILFSIGGLRGDHLSMGGVILVLSYGGPPARNILKFLLPLLLTGIIYDSQRFYSNYIRGPIHVAEPYFFDRRFFGISYQGQILTPNEWWQHHLHPVLDLITGFAYLVFIFVFLLGSAYMVYWKSRTGTAKCSAAEIQEKSPRMMWSFFWVNMLGYSTYYWYAAAPPWYVAKYGLGPANLSVPADAAGCLRFDQILGTHFFTEMYGRAADVFGAIPSLHVAYPLLGMLYAFKFGSGRIFNILFYSVMCFSAVYLNHHYLLDLIWGSGYALIIFWIINQVGDYRLRRRNA